MSIFDVKCYKNLKTLYQNIKSETKRDNKYFRYIEAARKELSLHQEDIKKITMIFVVNQEADQEFKDKLRGLFITPQNCEVKDCKETFSDVEIISFDQILGELKKQFLPHIIG